jgi:hypothetical protein
VDAVQVQAFRLIAHRLSRVAWDRLLLWALAAGGVALRLSLIARPGFHGDEAIYGYWAQLIASGQDPLLLSVPLDKPPLFIYLLAGVFKLFGPGEIAARLISESASVAAMGLVYALGRRLYGRQAALLAVAVMALSPFNILFAPTAFTDPLMVSLVLAAIYLAVAGRWGWAGVVAGLAVATKQQGIFFVPLVATVGWIAGHGRDGVSREDLSKGAAVQDLPASIGAGYSARGRTWGLARMGLGLLGVVQWLVGWDALRWRVRASFWEQSAVSHGPLRLVGWWELGERLAGWSDLLGTVLGSPLLNAILLLGMPFLLWRGRRALRVSGHGSPGLSVSPYSLDQVRMARVDWLLAGFSALFFVVHWLLSFSPWDRYLLGLVPLAALLLARTVWQGAVRAGVRQVGLVGLALVILLAGPAVEAVQASYPIGGDHDTYQGLDGVISFFRHQAPAGSVVWHRYLGWHYFYYLFDAPLELCWYDEPAVLAAKVSPAAGRANYVAFPAREASAEAETRAALRMAGLSLVQERRTWREDGRLAFTVYRIVGQETQSGEALWMEKQ